MGGNTVRGYAGAHAGADIIPGNRYQRGSAGFGAAVHLGMDVRFSQDRTRGLFSLDASGLYSASNASHWLGFTPQAGFGIESPHVFWRLMAGPAFSPDILGVGFSGRTELGLRLAPRVALTLGVGIGHWSQLATSTQIESGYDCNYSTGDCETYSENVTTRTAQSVTPIRPFLGIQVFFGGKD